jgi:hypothetical protein
MQGEFLVASIMNSDDRLYKYILNNILSNDKLYLQRDTGLVKKMISSLKSANIPYKYTLKRIKLLSQYISLVPYFNFMIKCFDDIRIIIKLHQYYYTNPHDFSSLVDLLKIYHLFDVTNEIFDRINTLRNLLKTDGEKLLFDLLVSNYYVLYNNVNEYSMILVEKMVKDNINDILNNINWTNFIKTLEYNKLNYDILHIITKYNYVTNIVGSQYNSLKMVYEPICLFFTRFFPVDSHTNMKLAVKINLLLHNLRLYVKRKTKNKIVQHQIKMFKLLNEITTYTPNKNKQVLKNGSYLYQCQKQKFTNLPPRHLFPGELSIYKKFLLREKVDGILINNLPINIFPQINIINNYQVKAEYIEELDLYLIFDIDIPNTTIVERYNILRRSHYITFNSQLETVSSFDDFISLVSRDKNNIVSFLNENKKHQIKFGVFFNI